MTAPLDVQRLGHAVLLQGDALTLVTHLAAVGASQLARNNGHSAASTRDLLNQLARADREARAMSASGHADVRTDPIPAQSDRPMGSGEVAGELGHSPRHVRRLAAEGVLPGHRTGRGWQFDLDEIRAHLAQTERDHP